MNYCFSISSAIEVESPGFALPNLFGRANRLDRFRFECSLNTIEGPTMAALLQRLFQRRPARDAADLERWLCDLPQSAEYQSHCLALEARPELRSITTADEMATILSLVGKLRPALCIEIGTFFAGTTRVIAEALHEIGAGKLITIDPYGGHRVPAILETWPAALQERVEFRPVNSMTMFDDLETNRLPKGGRSPLAMVFVDGNHSFEYAFFDVIRSADMLAPGGAIVIDNMDQQGPTQAAIRFMGWNPAWKLFAGGRIYDSASSALAALSAKPVGWGVLLAPRGIQIADMAYKQYERSVPNRIIKGVHLNVIDSSGPGTITVNLNYHAYPYDYHLTGTGIVQEIRSAGASHSPGHATRVEFAAAELVLASSEFNVNRELEVIFAPRSGSGYLLLDPNEPFTFS